MAPQYELIVNPPAPNTPYFTPAQVPAAGTAVDHGKPIPKLFQPLTIRGLTFHNRIFLSPLCQYSAQDGFIVSPWHMAHLGGIFTRGPGLSIIEATSILPEGRITPEDVGIWSDAHIEGLQKIVEFAHSQNQKMAIQLAHAGRKASSVAPWIRSADLAVAEVGGWPDDLIAPSAIPYNDRMPVPNALTKEGIRRVVAGFVSAAKRSLQAGFDVIEIHNAHGYLLFEFLSPISNKRTDEYGGSFENRIRLTLEIVDAVRSVIPDSMPLFLRVSATDWLDEALPNEPSWTVDDTVRFAGILAEHGVDFLDVSSGGNHPSQKIRFTETLYQAPFAEAVKKAHGDKIYVGAVGNINTGPLANGLLESGRADVAIVGRHFQKNPGAVWAFADELGVDIHAAHQMEWGFKGRAQRKIHENDISKPKPKM